MPVAQLTLDNYLPLEQLPKQCSFKSLIRTSSKSYKVHLEISRPTQYSPYYAWDDIIGNGNTPNEAYIMATRNALKKLEREAA